MKIDSINMLDQLKMIKGVQEKDSTSLLSKTPASGESKPVSFAEMFKEQYEETNQLGINAERAINDSIMGRDKNPHNTVIAVQKANVSLTLMMGIKERLERAYQELIRTPIG